MRRELCGWAVNVHIVKVVTGVTAYCVHSEMFRMVRSKLDMV